MAILSLPDVTATTNSNVALSSTSVLANWVQVQASSNNSATARIGDGNISATRGAIISASGSQFAPPAASTNQYDLSQIFIRGTTSDTFQVIYNTV
jgi:hypothetical protein